MYRIGIDLGGTNIAAGILKDKEIIKTMSVPTNAGRPVPEIVADMAMLCTKLIEGTGVDVVDSIGIGSPGVVDFKNGIIKNAVNISPEPIEIRKLMANYFDIPVNAENDANCAAIGEAVCGASAGYENSVMVTLGTGVGGGVIINGKLFAGAAGGGGEIGHMTIYADNAVKCKCGRTGCFEQYASTNALVRMMREAISENDTELDGRYIFDHAKNNDKTALAVLDRYRKHLADGLANIINIFQPEIIVIGGGISAQGEYLLAPVRKMVYDQILTKDPSITKIVKAELENNAGITGAAFCGQFR